MVIDLICIEQDGHDWQLYAAKLETEAEIQLSNEHDRYMWVPFDEALKLCRPKQVSKAFIRSAQALVLK